MKKSIKMHFLFDKSLKKYLTYKMTTSRMLDIDKFLGKQENKDKGFWK